MTWRVRPRAFDVAIVGDFWFSFFGLGVVDARIFRGDSGGVCGGRAGDGDEGTMTAVVLMNDGGHSDIYI